MKEENTVQKIVVHNRAESNNIYFDFEKDFPQLGCEYIEQTCGNAVTDVDADTPEIERVQYLIATRTHQACDKQDYDYVRGLIEAWGL